MADENNQEQQFLNPSRRSYVYESSKGTRGNKRVIFIVIGIIILIALVVAAIIATGGKGESEKNITPTPSKPTETPTPSPTTAPTPTGGKTTPTATPKASPTPTKATPTSKVSTTPTGTSSTTLDRSNLKVAVLNGSGEAGAATKASDALKKLGYEVVSSGNADNFDYETTTIQIKSAKKSYLDMLKTDLSDTYTIGSATPDYTGNSDAVVIVGKK